MDKMYEESEKKKEELTVRKGENGSCWGREGKNVKKERGGLRFEC